MNSEEKILIGYAEILANKHSIGTLRDYLEYLEENKPNSFAARIARKAYQMRKFNLIREME